jgi:hypothetical protein
VRSISSNEAISSSVKPAFCAWRMKPRRCISAGP